MATRLAKASDGGVSTVVAAGSKVSSSCSARPNASVMATRVAWPDVAARAKAVMAGSGAIRGERGRK